MPVVVILVVLIGAGLLFYFFWWTVEDDPIEEWQTYTYLDDNFKIKFPSEADIFSDTSGDYEAPAIITAYSASPATNENEYSVVSIVFDPDQFDETISGVGGVLESISKNFGTENGEELASLEKTEFLGRQARSYTSQESKDGLITEGKAFLINNTLYNLMVGYENDDEYQGYAKHFFDSFEVIDENIILIPDITTQEDILMEADYNDGFNAGYADGRARAGSFLDSYQPPANSDRQGVYALGYLDGAIKGCYDGGYDFCEAFEQEIQKSLSDEGVDIPAQNI